MNGTILTNNNLNIELTILFILSLLVSEDIKLIRLFFIPKSIIFR